MAEHIVLDQTYVKVMPNSLTFEEAAAMPYLIMQVWELLAVRANLGPGHLDPGQRKKKVLIVGGLRCIEILSALLAKQ